MSFIIIDGFEDRFFPNDGYEFGEYWEGWGLYPYTGVPETGAYFYDYWPNASVVREDGLWGGYCAMVPDSVALNAYTEISVDVQGKTHFSGGIAVNSTNADCQLLTGVDYNTGGTSRRYGPALETDADGGLILYRSQVGTITREMVARSTKTGIFTNWNWHYVTFQFVCESLSTDWIKVWVDGDLVLDVSGTKMNNGGVLDRLDFPDYVHACDDMWLRDDTTVFDQPHIPAIFPTGAGTYTECTPVGGENWDNVNDFEQDLDSSYNLGGVGDKDSFVMGDITETGTVKALCARFLVSGEAGNTDKIRPFVIVNSTKYNGSDYAVTNDRYTYIQHIWETNPDTSSAWTAGEINGAEIGYEVVSG